MTMRCRQCGSNNNSKNRLCLTCGYDLLEPREPSDTPPPEQPLIQPAGESSVVPVADATDDLTYVFQDEVSHARRYFVLAMIGLALAVVGWQLRDLHNLVSRFLKDSATTQSRAGNSTQANASMPAAELPVPQNGGSEPAGLAAKPDQSATGETSSGNPSQEGSVSVPGMSKAKVQPVSANAGGSETPETEGVKYLYGDGVPVNCERAQQSLLAAAEHSSAKAESTLGTMYATGHCTIRDLPLAYRWFSRAQHQNPRNRIIADDMKVLWDQMSPEEKTLAKR